MAFCILQMVQNTMNNGKTEAGYNHLDLQCVRNYVSGKFSSCKGLFFFPSSGDLFLSCTSLFLSICILIPTETAKLLRYALEKQSSSEPTLNSLLWDRKASFIHPSPISLWYFEENETSTNLIV